MFVIAIAAGVYALTDPKVLCAICADTPAPAFLPALTELAPVTIPQSWTKFSQRGVVPLFDVKTAQVGERDPGEDDE